MLIKKFGSFSGQKSAQLTPALHTEELQQYRFDAEETHTLLRNCCPCEAEESQCTVLSFIVFATDDMSEGRRLGAVKNNKDVMRVTLLLFRP